MKPRPTPPAPTSAAPGSPEKIAVLTARARLRCALYHPEDRTGARRPALVPTPDPPSPGPRCTGCRRPRTATFGPFKLCPPCRARKLARYHATRPFA